jgi:formylglycine-generating enzyme required for sulfatase activity/cytochrome c553
MDVVRFACWRWGTAIPVFLVWSSLAWTFAWGAEPTGSDNGTARQRDPVPSVGAGAVSEPQLSRATPASLRLAIEDLAATFGAGYPRAQGYLEQLETVQRSRLEAGETRGALGALAAQALLDNPLLDFERLLVVKRRPVAQGQPGSADTAFGHAIGLPRSSMGHSVLPRDAFDNTIAVLEPVSPDGRVTPLYRPPNQDYVGDLNLDFDARRLLFSARDDCGAFRIFEIGIDGSQLRQVSRGQPSDVNCYRPVYLPDGDILFLSTANFQCVPCNGTPVSLVYRMNGQGGKIRQLTFDQDHCYDPVVMPDGRILYLRWEYSDLPHSNSRILFTMNPDGTAQTPYYGAGSYWPNSLFGARPIPGRSGMFLGIVAGHHDSYREGELVLFDVQRGRHEASGVVQRIPGRGQEVKPLVADRLTAESWPKFVHPFPLSDKYFLVTGKLGPDAPWALYLADVFDNLLLLHHAEGYGLFEPIPVRATPRPPVLEDRTVPDRGDAVVRLNDVYHGTGLEGVPRGTVKRLRLYTYHFAYRGRGGLMGTIGLDGPWDVRRVLGTVPVEPDGSACFRIPANTPVSLQPLDAEGKALQQMRSWLVGMPGESVSCAGCHEPQDTTPQAAAPSMQPPRALMRAPSEITPWYGPVRNFSFQREVQPVIDRHCVACHDGSANGQKADVPDLRGDVLTADYRTRIDGNRHGGQRFSEAYFQLSRYVRRAGIESDMRPLVPGEFHADTTDLVRMLQQGHHGVPLDEEDWDRLITWIDMNAPYHGTWTEAGLDPGEQRQRRREWRWLYAGVDEDPEALAEVPPPARPVSARPKRWPAAVEGSAAPLPEAADWPFDAAEARRRQATAAEKWGPGGSPEMAVELGPGPILPAAYLGPDDVRQPVDLSTDTLRLELVLVPGGSFVMGSTDGVPDESPPTVVQVEPFWMGKFEVTNAQYRVFDPSHESRDESRNGYQFGRRGFYQDGPWQPVVRVSWQRAMAFCQWLSERTGLEFTLPTEAQWEHACRAGSNAAFHFGALDSDYSPYANLADRRLRDFAQCTGVANYLRAEPIPDPNRYDDWIPRCDRYDDGGLVTVDVGSYQPNPWGLYDLHGNVWEWTRSEYRSYPYDAADGREAAESDGWKVVRGGSWRDRPQHSRAATRWRYPAWQPVFHVGFRVAAPVSQKDVPRGWEGSGH